MISLGVDLGRNLGLNVIENDGSLVFSNVYLLDDHGDDIVQMAQCLKYAVADVWNHKYRWEAVFIEEPPFVNNHKRYAELKIMEYALVDFLDTTEITATGIIHSLNNKSIKLHLTGDGDASKREIFDEVGRRFNLPLWEDYKPRAKDGMNIKARDIEQNARDSIAANLYGRHLVEEGEL